MSKKFVNVYFVLALLVFALSISLFGSNIAKEYKFNAENSEKIFEQLSSNFEKQTILESVKSYREKNEIIACEVIRNDKPLYTKTEYFDFENSGSMIKTYKTQKVIDSDSYVLKFAFYLITPDSIYNNAKTSFLIILGMTILTALLIILSSNGEKQEETYSSDSKTEEIGEIDTNTAETAQSEETEIDSESFTEATEPKEENLSSEITEKQDESKQEEEAVSSESNEEVNTERKTEEISETNENNVTIDDKFQSVQEEDISIFPEEEKNEEIQTEPETPALQEPSVEKKPETPLVSKINELLENNTIDFSIFLLKSPSVDIIETIKDFLAPGYFEKSDIFDYNSDTIALVKTDMNIDEAENFASKFHATLTEKLSGKLVKIGISSRATRKITAERLITEVVEALKHSQSDNESNIIGFHVDIEKYNEYLKASEKQN